MWIKKLIIDQFKGIHHAEYEFGETINQVEGENGSGKTTIPDAVLWLFVDCNYNLRFNPLVAPLDMAESSPSVTAVCDIDGTEVTITKIQTNTRTETEEGVKRSSNNRYVINEVPVTQRDFKKKLLQYGIDTDLILPCVHPMVFTSQKGADMKKILFDMASDKTDLDVAKTSEETAYVAKLLEKYTSDELIAKSKATKKKSDEMIKAIPERITGLEQAKVAADENPIIDEINSVEGAIELGEAELKLIDEERAKQSGELEKIRHALFDAQRAVVDFEKEEELNEAHFKRKQAEHSLEVKKEINDFSARLAELHIQGKRLEAELSSQCAKKEIATKQYRDKKAEKAPELTLPRKLTERDMVCPCCGQELPADQKQKKIKENENRIKMQKADNEAVLAHWKKSRDASLKKIADEGQAACDAIREIERKQELLAISIANTQKELNLRQTRLEKALAEETEQYKPSEETLKKREEVTVAVKDAKRQFEEASQKYMESDPVERKKAINDTLRGLRSKAQDLTNQLAVIRKNSDIDAQIESLQNERMKYEQSKATAEKILYQMDILSRMKNDLLVEDINSHFSLVKFQLFEYQKNGNYKEVCVPTIDGYRFGESTNTGRELRGKIDICHSLQKFYGMNLPILLDNAESLNSYNVPDVDRQLIMMRVTDDKELVIKHD